ncbi:MAG TPA: hypothetical protein VMG38_07125 [Trebonia sp.]|nr:hypothetical protein [Trebonia sp.]
MLEFLIKGPGRLRSLPAMLAVTLLAVAGAALLVWSAVIHLELWSDGYRDIPNVGPLFLIASVADIILALLALALRRLIVLLAGAGSLIATAGGLLLSAHGSLFGYKESLAVPYAMLSLYVEFVGAGVLLVGVVLLALAPVRPGKSEKRSNPSHAPSRT